MLCRGKFQCESVKDFGNRKEIALRAVCNDGTPENERFHKYTPSGLITMTVDNPNIVFTPEKYYYVDFTEIE